MNNDLRIERLNDFTRLNEVYDLRVRAWEESQGSFIINQVKFPHGFKDEFDDESIHLVALNSEEQIVSACRLTIFDSLKNYPYIKLPALKILEDKAFGLIGRGVRKKDIKAKRLQYEFVSKCIDICKEQGVEYATGHAYDINVYMQNLMLELGFKFLCAVNEDNYNNREFAFKGKLFLIQL